MDHCLLDYTASALDHSVPVYQSVQPSQWKSWYFTAVDRRSSGFKGFRVQTLKHPDRAVQVYAQLRAASRNLAVLYMHNALDEAAQLPVRADPLKVDVVLSHLVGSGLLALRVDAFAGGLNGACAGLLARVRQQQSRLRR